MYTGIKHLHSTFAYLVLGLLIITVVAALIKFLTNKEFGGLKKLALFSMIFSHLQLLAGIVIYFLSPLGIQNSNPDKMSNGIERLYFLEHPLVMILALVLITIGNSKSKKALGDQQKNKTILIFFGLGLILILTRIPWQVWPSFLG